MADIEKVGPGPCGCVVCPSCGGSGDHWVDGNADEVGELEPCEECRGRGSVEFCDRCRQLDAIESNASPKVEAEF